jgi:hypothetical protein
MSGARWTAVPTAVPTASPPAAPVVTCPAAADALPTRHGSAFGCERSIGVLQRRLAFLARFIGVHQPGLDRLDVGALAARAEEQRSALPQAKLGALPLFADSEDKPVTTCATAHRLIPQGHWAVS